MRHDSCDRRLGLEGEVESVPVMRLFGIAETSFRREVRPFSIWVGLHSTTGRMIASSASTTSGMSSTAALPSSRAAA